ncbi:MAG: hypothetical protein NVV73_05805 [Cellvibrionaceae bacterium]|nr:hypothetical protein [Cellvibrionaceae bacterium]
MTFRSLLCLVMVVLISGCTTLLANEVNRFREKNGGCDLYPEAGCIDLVKTAITDIAIGVDIARNLMESNPLEAPIPEIDKGEIQCDVEYEKICSASRGCHCMPQTVQGDTL